MSFALMLFSYILPVTFGLPVSAAAVVQLAAAMWAVAFCPEADRAARLPRSMALWCLPLAVILLNLRGLPGQVALKYILWFIIGIASIAVSLRKGSLERIYRLLFIVAGIVFASVCVQLVFPGLFKAMIEPLIFARDTYYYQYNAAHGIIYGIACDKTASTLIGTLCVAAAFFCGGGMGLRLWVRGLLAAMGAFLCAMAGSRTSLVFIPVFIFAVYLLSAPRKRMIRIALLGAGAAAGCAAAFALLAVLFPDITVVRRITDTLSGLLSGGGLGSVSSGRDLLFGAAIEGIKEAPLLGHGWFSFNTDHTGIIDEGTSSFVHNIVLQLLYDTGIVGTILFLSPPVYFCFRTLRLLRRAGNSGRSVRTDSLLLGTFIQLQLLADSMLHVGLLDPVMLQVYFLALALCFVAESELCPEAEERMLTLSLAKPASYLRQGCFAVGSVLTLAASLLIRREEKRLAFGSWMGRLYIDNSRYLLEQALAMYGPDWRFVWVGGDSVKAQLPDDPRIVCVKKNSVPSLFHLLRCKYMFCSQLPFEDLSEFNVYRGAVVTYLHHGCPVKKWGDDTPGRRAPNPIRRILNLFTGASRRLDYFTASSKAHARTNLTALKSYGCTASNNLPAGTPRNDMLVRLTPAQSRSFKEQYSRRLGFSPDKRVILYVPTFRRSGAENRSLIAGSPEETAALAVLLRELDCVLIEKAHFAGSFGDRSAAEHGSELIPCPKDVNLQEMLTFADCVISDYSGAFLDFSLLDRPIIHYLYDHEFYRDSDSGLYYGTGEFAAGPIAEDHAHLLRAVKHCMEDSGHQRRKRLRVRDRFMHYETGTASRQILERVVGS